MNFVFSMNDEWLSGDLIYRENEYSIDFVCSSSKQLEKKSGQQGYMSLTVNTLQLEVGIETGALLYPWGLFPLMNAETRAIEVPVFKRGSINVQSQNSSLIAGVSLSIPESNSWKTIRAQEGKWIYIGPDDIPYVGCSYIEFASGAVVGLKEGSISSIFLMPNFIDM